MVLWRHDAFAAGGADNGIGPDRSLPTIPEMSIRSDTEPAEPLGLRTRWLGRVRALWRRLRLGNVIAVGLPMLGLVSGIGTYAALTGAPPLGGRPSHVLLLLNLDLILLLLLTLIVVWRIVRLWIARRRGSAGSRLHLRLSVLFGVVAVAPTIFVVTFSVLFFDLGIQSWFSERVEKTLEGARAASQGYLEEHQENIRADILRMARDLNRDAPLLETNGRLLNQAVNLQAQLRGIPEAIVFDGTGKVVARSGLTYALEFEPIEGSYIESARGGEVPIFVNDGGDRVRALVRLDSFLDAYLFVGRFVDSSVLAHTEQTRDAVEEFYNLKARSSDIQISFTLIFLIVALLMMTAAVWLGLYVASDISRPISELIGAVEKVRGGDLSARVRELPPDDEIGSLSRSFNRMTDQLDSQRRELVDTNRQLTERRQFTETVLSGVSAGVIGLDRRGRITLPNLSAARLLDVEVDDMIGKPVETVMPEMSGLLKEARRRPDVPVETQIKIKRGDEVRMLLLTIAVEELKGKIIGFVVTFDDVSALMEAQWKGAWADVARRIAHEIRNPLTPIQLSAERLKRKYLSEIESDRETFETCIDTIVRQVDDIGRMIEEFSNFARMPAPALQLENLNELCRQAIFLQRNAHADIEFTTEFPEAPAYAVCDGRQIGQAVTNLLQNAAEALEREGGAETGQVTLRIVDNEHSTVIEVADNGPGLPAEGREQLTEPYVTTRRKGTGLGLAIVRKIMEDHGGSLTLLDTPDGGALVRMELSRDASQPRKGRDRRVNSAKETATHGS